MRLFGKLIGGRIGSSIKSDDPLQGFIANLEAATGYYVTPLTAVRVIAVLACLRVIAEDIGKLPFKLFQHYDPKDDRKRRLARDHKLYRVLSSRPNEWMTSQEFRETFTAIAALWGGAYAFKRKSAVDGEIYELLPIGPGRVKTNQASDYTITYTVSNLDGSQKTYSRDEIFHLKGLSFDFVDGARIYHLARTAIELAMAAEQYQVNFARGGARPSGLLSTDTTLTPEQLKDARKAWSDNYGGPENASKMPILHSGLKFVAMGMTGRDAELIATRKNQVIDICRAWRVHPNKLYAMESTQTFASAEQFGIEHVQDTIMPWAVRWEQTTERDLLSEEDVEAGYFPKLMLQGLLRADMAARAAYLSKAIGRPWMSANEGRVLDELDPLDGLDEVILPLNVSGAKTADDAQTDGGSDANSKT